VSIFIIMNRLTFIKDYFFSFKLINLRSLVMFGMYCGGSYDLYSFGQLFNSEVGRSWLVTLVIGVCLVILVVTIASWQKMVRYFCLIGL
jgi:hypothetical protein